MKQSCGFDLINLRFLIILVLVLGIFFRFYNLDRKVYWLDEAFTSLRISGYTEAELVQQIFDGHEIGVRDLQKYQQPNSEKGLINTIKSLAVEEPQHSPLYFIMARLWVQWFGNSVAVTRSLTAFISLLVFPCVYWLCLELFKSPLIGWMAIALMAISPFHVVFAQEARSYTLWTVTVLLASAALLRAMRINTKQSWVVYAATVSLGLYSFLFSGFVAIGHGIYVAITERFRLNKTVAAYLLASLIGLLGFAPWLVIIATNSVKVSDKTSWMTNQKLSILTLSMGWASNIKVIFLDLNIIGSMLTPLILILVGYSLYFLCRKSEIQIWLFILTLIGPMALGLILPDLIFGGGRSVVSRYLIPCYLGIELSVAHLLATQIVRVNFSQKLWKAVMAVVISLGVMSCAISSQADTWWNKGGSNLQVAPIINQATRPLLVSDISAGNPVNLLSLSYLLSPKVRLRLVDNPNLLQIPDSFSDVFLYMPSKALQDVLKKDYTPKLCLVFQTQLWHLKKL